MRIPDDAELSVKLRSITTKYTAVKAAVSGVTGPVGSSLQVMYLGIVDWWLRDPRRNFAEIVMLMQDTRLQNTIGQICDAATTAIKESEKLPVQSLILVDGRYVILGDNPPFDLKLPGFVDTAETTEKSVAFSGINLAMLLHYLTQDIADGQDDRQPTDE